MKRPENLATANSGVTIAKMGEGYAELPQEEAECGRRERLAILVTNLEEDMLSYVPIMHVRPGSGTGRPWSCYICASSLQKHTAELSFAE
ncbi:hypothetical protein PAAG_01342 [Paracoccidioides lutzii Pb01]|uniref:Uncharacterized protein n=1 Tax=Paracoccidioides lutzii (strain ATCC MYA-826 / Pb01) TaxID=502779 RepID=C1GS47_PARBA|nr:hypothetical protein PAAG_01342 [Paracoccidioides lutzii Pb01]EEH38880.2 hypothetical protein PAAG_01342 [Paracoccidioides lutzii Pb01]